MANPVSLPLFEKLHLKNTTQRAMDIIILFLLFCLLFYRLLSLNHHGLAWFLAFLCESWFTFNWLLVITTRWTPMLFKPFPERLHQRVPEMELPPVDMFVTTADPVLEPPILTVNTVLSLLAVDYPANKLACYVSDDGCSPLVYYSLVEASKFAKLWVPFCKKYKLQVRAPFRYFLDESPSSSANASEFQQEWNMIKEEYEQLRRNIEDAARKPPFDLTRDFAVFLNTETRNHPTIIQVIWENTEGLSDGVPHVIYIAREKRQKHPHHYKAGAMNVLTRVSGLMTNAPFMLNVDCDMYVNNPEVFRQAMCLLLGSGKERDCAYVQSPQMFYDRPEQLLLLHEYVGKGIVGIQGPFYAGSGCFHRRKVIYGLCPEDLEDEGKMKKKLSDNELRKEFGDSEEFLKSAAQALKGESDFPSNYLSKSLEASHQVASCTYDCSGSWGKKLGWRYGSTTEDILTGLVIQSEGWRSGYLSPDPPAFLGCAPPGGPPVMVQQKRWATGLLEVLFSESNPISATLTAKLEFRQCVAYLWLLLWGLRSIPELCYAVLPAYCIITNSNFLPKASRLYIFLVPFVTFNIYNLSEFIRTGFPVRAWWIYQCMSRIITLSAWLFGVINVVLKFIGLSETVFEVTQKGQSTSSEDDEEKFVFDESSIFVPITTVVLAQLTALVTWLLGLQPRDGQGPGLGELFCCVYVLLSFMPFVQGLLRKGKYGIPLSTISKSVALVLCFLLLCRRSSITIG